MKLIIQIPCYNEEKSLPVTIADLPRELSGIDKVELLVIDDGSDDRTSAVARELGVEHVVRFANHKGLARAFTVGIDAGLRLGADIIVNTDADNQYRGVDVEKLIKPIIDGKADMVLGDRQIDQVEFFSAQKKFLQKLGAGVVRKLSGTDVPDATTGFRAFNREAALSLNVVSNFSYTLETIIQAGVQNIAITSVPIETNKPLRPSRLFKSMRDYIRESVVTIVRIYVMYSPLKAFLYFGMALLMTGTLIGLRFMWFYLHGDGRGHVQSLLLAAVLFIFGFQAIAAGLLADVIAANRRLLEMILYKIKRNEASDSRQHT